MTNVARGHQAETVAAAYLERHGYKLLALNWKRPRAEIDIIAQAKDQPLLFIEAKYRENDRQGTGLDYFPARKLAQMRFAAELWVHEQRYQGEYALAAIGKAYRIQFTGNGLVDRQFFRLHQYHPADSIRAVAHTRSTLHDRNARRDERVDFRGVL